MAWSSLPRHWFPPKGTGEPRLSPVSGALHFLSHPSPRCCRARHAYFLRDGASHWFPQSGTEKPRISQRGMRASSCGKHAAVFLPFEISRLLRQLVLRQIETAVHCAEKYSSNEAGVGLDQTGSSLRSISMIKTAITRTRIHHGALARHANARSCQLWALHRAARRRRLPDLQHAQSASTKHWPYCAEACRTRP